MLGEASGAGEALEILARTREILARTRSRLVLTEVHLDSRNAGLRLCTELKQSADPPLVVVHTADNDPEMITSCLTAGADGFIHKSSEPEALVETLISATRGRRPWVLGRVSERVSGRASGLDVRPELTGRENEVLRLLLARLSNQEIAEELHLAHQTVKNYAHSVMHKLGVSSRRQLLGLAQGDGYGEDRESTAARVPDSREPRDHRRWHPELPGTPRDRLTTGA